MLKIDRFGQIAVTAILIGCSREPEPSAAQNRPAGSSGVAVPVNDQVSQSRQNAITAAVAKTAPAVVTVQTEAVDQTPQDPFEIFFGGGQRLPPAPLPLLPAMWSGVYCPMRVCADTLAPA